MSIVGRRFDLQIGGKGFLLARGEFRGRAWRRSGRSDAPAIRSATDAEYGTLPDELDHPEVWNDWTGGFGHAYRETGQPTYHWAENFDSRFPKQLVHCQLPNKVGSSNITWDDVQQMIVVPPQVDASAWAPQFRRVGILAWSGWGYGILSPNSSGTLDIYAEGNVGGSKNQWDVGRPVVVGTGMAYVPKLSYTGLPTVAHLVNPQGLQSTNDIPYRHFAQSNDRVWIAIGGSGNLRPAVRSVVGDPVATANLSATLLVGPGPSQINDLLAFEDELAVGLTDGLYIGDRSGTFVNVMPFLSQGAHKDNLRDLMPWAGGVLAPTVQGLYHYRSGGFTAEVAEVSIPAGRSPVRGYIRALGHCGPWVYGAQWTGSATHILATRDLPSPNPRWHTLHRFPSMVANRIFFDGITTASGVVNTTIPQRQYLAMSADYAATYPLYYWPVPYNDDNPLAAQVAFSARYIGSARIDLGAVDWGSPGTPKLLRDVEIEANNLASGAQWCQVYYDVDQSGSFTLLGTVAKSPKDTLYFPSGEGSFVTGQSVELSLRSFTASAGVTPVYRALVLRGALQARSVDLITAVVRIGDGIRDRQNGEMRSGATMLKELRDFANPDAQGLQAHQLIDLAGATQWVKVLPPIDEAENYQKGDDYPEVAATVKMAVLTFS